jgi:L-alanine-DL-glutamate epimerase-like enolase superfamily enzyme
MEITAVQAFPVRVDSSTNPFVGTAGVVGHRNGSGRYRRVLPYRPLFAQDAETLFVRLETSNGLVGWGESQAGVGARAVAAIIEDILSSVIIGRDARATSVLWDDMFNTMRDRGHGGGFMLDAIAAVDIALWDLCGQFYGEPISRLLGGSYRTALPTYLSGPRGDTTDERIADTKAFVDRGFSAVKLFIGRGVDADLAEVSRFREAFGSSIELMVDAQWLYTVSQALELGKGLQALDVRFLETPINPEDIAGLEVLSGSLSMAIAAGETERTRWQALPFLERRAARVWQPDVGRCGISEALRIALLADLYHVPVAFHCGVGFGPYIAATLQTAAATPNLMYVEYQPDMHQLAKDHYGFEFVVEDGCLVASEDPGLGLGGPSERLITSLS